MSPNPYGWRVEDPRHQIRRPELSIVLDKLRKGEAVMVSGGRGMGKSVLRQQVEKELEGERLQLLSIGAPGLPAAALTALFGSLVPLKRPRALTYRAPGYTRHPARPLEEPGSRPAQPPG